MQFAIIKGETDALLLINVSDDVMFVQASEAVTEGGWHIKVMRVEVIGESAKRVVDEQCRLMIRSYEPLERLWFEGK